MNIEGYTYQQARTFDTLEKAASNRVPPGNISGAAMGLGLGMGMGNIMGGMAGSCDNLGQNPPQPPQQQPYTPPKFNPPAGGIAAGFGAPAGGKATAVFCSKCGTKFSPDVKFPPALRKSLPPVPLLRRGQRAGAGDKGVFPAASLCPNSARSAARRSLRDRSSVPNAESNWQ